MSSAGTYLYWPKVEHPNAVFPQMASASLQPPFFFGGSQVPINLGGPHHILGEGVHTHSLDGMKYQHLCGRGIHPHYNHTNKIVLPKHMSSIKRVI